MYKQIIECPNYCISTDSEIKNIKTNKIIKPWIGRNGYLYISLVNYNSIKINRRIHRLVAITYIDNPLNKPCVNHIDGIITNNNISNLEWCDYKENIYHSKKITKNGAVISKQKILQLYNTNLSIEEFKNLLIDNCN